MPIPARVTVDACLEGSDDLDQFAVMLEKGVRYLVLCEAVTPCDARAEVVVRDRQSTVVARLDARDVLSGKKGFEWQPTVTGQYTVNVQGRALSVTELPTIPYRLVVEPAQPKIELFVARDVFQLPQEGRVDLEITAERWGGASGEIKLTATDLGRPVSALTTP